jgi:hypothetical protein
MGLNLGFKENNYKLVWAGMKIQCKFIINQQFAFTKATIEINSNAYVL